MYYLLIFPFWKWRNRPDFGNTWNRQDFYIWGISTGLLLFSWNVKYQPIRVKIDQSILYSHYFFCPQMIIIPAKVPFQFHSNSILSADFALANSRKNTLFQFLLEKPLLMSKSSVKRKNATIEDEKEFTDLLFGDVKEVVNPVCSTFHNWWIGPISGFSSRNKRTFCTLARFGRRRGACEHSKCFSKS